MGFEVGNEVQLKSGGPIMTVEAISDSGLVDCVWFTKDGVERDSFPAEALVPYTG